MCPLTWSPIRLAERMADRAVELADHDLGLGAEVIGRTLDQGLARSQNDPLAHGFTSRLIANCQFRQEARVKVTSHTSIIAPGGIRKPARTGGTRVLAGLDHSFYDVQRFVNRTLSSDEQLILRRSSHRQSDRAELEEVEVIVQHPRPSGLKFKPFDLGVSARWLACNQRSDNRPRGRVGSDPRELALIDRIKRLKHESGTHSPSAWTLAKLHSRAAAEGRCLLPVQPLCDQAVLDALPRGSDSPQKARACWSSTRRKTR